MVNLLFQASVGPCNIPEPSTWKIVEHSKWARFVCFEHYAFFAFLCYYYTYPLNPYILCVCIDMDMDLWSCYACPCIYIMQLFSYEYCI